MPKPLKTFIIYAREDAVFKNELLRQLAPFAQMGLLEKWDDSHILPGEEWEKSIEKALEASHIVLMLVSADSLFSEFIQRKELRKALEQKREGVTRVIPILVRDCMYNMAEGIGDLQMLPLHPVSRLLAPVDNYVIWGSRDSAWAAALRQLLEVVNDVHARIEAEEKIQREQAEKLAALAAEAQRKREAAEIKKAEEAAKDLAAKEAKIQREKEAKAAAERKRIKDEATWKATIKLNTLVAYENYLDEGHTLHQDEAHQRIHDLTEAETERRAEQKAKEKAAKKAEEEKRARLATEAQREKEHDPFYDLMIPIKGGTFDMGDTFGEGYSSEKPLHKVTLPDFHLCKYPVTQAQWKVIMGNNPSGFKGEDLPVENVSWNDAQDFIKNLNEKTGKKYRLPSEAEWEFAAREGGKKVRFGNGKDIADPKEMNFNGKKDYKHHYSIIDEYREKTTPVSQFKPNGVGLHDMSGNVWEWCQDVWHESYKDAPEDGSAWEQGGDNSRRVFRGGSWYNDPFSCRAAYRNRPSPGSRSIYIGFRLAR
ncbi:MAG: SUMF1/EgtB/PvdO family nonheme iron enzyme [Saprospiraceae bacterium]